MERDAVSFTGRVLVLFDENNKWPDPYGVIGQLDTCPITTDGKAVGHLLGSLSESRMLKYPESVTSGYEYR